MSLRIQLDTEDIERLSLKVLRALRAILPKQVNAVLAKKADEALLEEKDE